MMVVSAPGSLREWVLATVRRVPRPLRLILAFVSGVGITVYAADHALDGATRHFVENLLSETFHAPARLDELRIDLLSGQIEAGGLVVENRQWGAERNLIAADRIRIEVELRPLPQRRIHVKSLEIDSPLFVFEAAGGRSNLMEALAGPPKIYEARPNPTPRPAPVARSAEPAQRDRTARDPGTGKQDSSTSHREDRSGSDRQAPLADPRGPQTGRTEPRSGELMIQIPVQFHVDRAEIRDGRVVYLDHGESVRKQPRRLDLKAVHLVVTDLASDTPYDQIKARAVLQAGFLTEGEQNLDVQLEANPFSRLLPFSARMVLAPTPLAPLSPWVERPAGFRLFGGTFQLNGTSHCRRGLVVSDTHVEGHNLKIEQLGGVELGDVMLQVPPEVVMLFLEREQGRIAFDTRVEGDLRDSQMDWGNEITMAVVGSVTHEILSKVGTLTNTGSKFLDQMGAVGRFLQGLFR